MRFKSLIILYLVITFIIFIEVQINKVMPRIIRLTENDLHAMVTNTLHNIIEEESKGNDKWLDIILRLLNGEDISMNVKSEKTALSAVNKLYKLSDSLHDISWFYPSNGNTWTDEERDYAAKEIERMQGLIPYDFVINNFDTVLKLQDCKPSRTVIKIADTKTYKYRDNEPTYKFGFVQNRQPIYGTFTMTCEEETHTSKRRTKEELKQLEQTVCDHIGTYRLDYNYNKTLPWGVGRYFHTTEEDFSRNMVALNTFLKEPIPNASSKQLQWVSKLMQIPYEQVSILNKYQCGELLTALFEINNNEYLKEDDDEFKILNFYKQKLGI